MVPSNPPRKFDKLKGTFAFCSKGGPVPPTKPLYVLLGLVRDVFVLTGFHFFYICGSFFCAPPWCCIFRGASLGRCLFGAVCLFWFCGEPSWCGIHLETSGKMEEVRSANNFHNRQEHLHKSRFQTHIWTFFAHSDWQRMWSFGRHVGQEVYKRFPGLHPVCLAREGQWSHHVLLPES